MSKDLYIQDTAKVHITSLVTGNVVGVGYAQVAGLEIATEETPVKGGIGNKTAYVIKSSKDLTLNVTSATFKPEFLAITQGNEYVDDVTAKVTDSMFITITDAGSGQPQIKLPTELNKLTTIRIEDLDGSQQDVAVTTGVAEIPVGYEATVGDEVEVFYLKEITGRKLEIDATKFSSKYKVEYQTLCYDRETEAVHSELYFVFDSTSPSGNLSMSLQNGEAFIPELNFTVTAPKGSDVLGTKYEVLRK